MGKAKVKAGLSHISKELVSASSTLRTPPEPIDEPKGEFLVDQDARAKHSAEHAQAALRSVRELRAVGHSILAEELKVLRALGLVEFRENKIHIIAKFLMRRLDEGVEDEINTSE